MINRFCRFELRTNNVPGARAFYHQLLGDEGLEINPLPAPAAARGAPAHWVGYIGVDDPEKCAGAFVGRGASQLGPVLSKPDGGKAVVLRESTGVIVGLATPPATEAKTRPVWQQLHTPAADYATSNYSQTFGWTLQERVNLGSAGVHQHFAWGPGTSSAGSITDITGSETVHPHWLFYFDVPDLAASIRMVSKLGGTAIGPIELPNGMRLAVCEDAQRAAFGIRETVAS